MLDQFFLKCYENIIQITYAMLDVGEQRGTAQAGTILLRGEHHMKTGIDDKQTTKNNTKKNSSKGCYWEWLEEAEKASFKAWNRSKKR